jgi:hypothetical protein
MIPRNILRYPCRAMSAKRSSLTSKLLVSGSVSSLLAERTVAMFLDRSGWRTGHGVYYRDVESGKVRELDVAASQRWRRKISKTQFTGAELHLLVECKSAPGFHIVFAPTLERHAPPLLPGQWIADREELAAILSRLLAAGLPAGEVTVLRAEVQELAFGDNHAPPLYVRPFAAPSVASFKETSIGNEKELENSVLWRAVMTLRSAVESLRRERLADRIDDFNLGIEMDQIDQVDPMIGAREQLLRLVFFHELYHPVVVIESSLWLVTAKGLKSVPWCRLELRDASQHADWWVDVVNAATAQEYFRLLSKHYSAQFRSQKARKGDNRVHYAPSVAGGNRT